MEAVTVATENLALDHSFDETKDADLVPGWYEQWPESAERSTLDTHREPKLGIRPKADGGGAMHGKRCVQANLRSLSYTVADLCVRQYSTKAKSHKTRGSRSINKGTYLRFHVRIPHTLRDSHNLSVR